MVGTRLPAVAGRFYERRAEDLRASLEHCFLHPLGPGHLPEVNPEGPGKVRALVSPHAGYMFSGPAAACGFAALAADGIPEVVIILGPSHYQEDRRAALSMASTWQTPLGEAPVDTALGAQLLVASDLVVADEQAHTREHSLEVQVPFIQFVYGARTPPIVPLCIRSHPYHDLEHLVPDAQALGEALAKVIGSRRAVLLASTDLTHQAPQEEANHKDRLALDAIEVISAERLLNTVLSQHITMCGSVPVAIALVYAQACGAAHAEVLRYYTSGDMINDYERVVGYTSVLLRAE